MKTARIEADEDNSECLWLIIEEGEEFPKGKAHPILPDEVVLIRNACVEYGKKQRNKNLKVYGRGFYDEKNK